VLVVMHSTDGEAKRFISRKSYDEDRQTIFIQSADGKTDANLSVARLDRLKLLLNKQEVLPELKEYTLQGRYAVSDVTMAPVVRAKANGAGVVAQEVTELDLVDYPRLLDSADVRQWLLGAVVLELAIILLIVTNAAASTVTREKEDGTLDLLLSTPITSRYYIWGKLRGLVAFVVPLIAVPVISVLLFVFHDFGRWAFYGDANFDWIAVPEAVIIMPGTLIIVSAFAAILGMQMSLRCRTTVRAVMSSVGIMAGACAALGWCGATIISSQRDLSDAALGIGAFSPFTLLTLLIDPYRYGGRAFDETLDPGNGPFARGVVGVLAVIAMGIYAIGVWQMYKSMVKNFDMTIRRQSR
jgi:ABC-type Na+ efflux pump permease subunit